MRRHRLAERFLTDILGLSWADAHKEAGKWEHVISDAGRGGDRSGCSATPPPARTATRSRARTTRRPPRSPSSELAVGDGFTVSRIPEELEFTPGPARVPRGRRRRCPAAPGTITAASPDGTTTVEIDGRHVGIGAFASARILVTR